MYIFKFFFIFTKDDSFLALIEEKINLKSLLKRIAGKTIAKIPKPIASK
jgi:hypothetical protein